MAGCSIVLLTIIFLPVLVVMGVVTFALMAAYEFVTSPAFPVLVASVILSGMALIDLARKLWTHYKEGTLRQLEAKEFVRPGLLFLAGFVLFVIVCVMSGSMIWDWMQEVQASGRAAREAREAARGGS